MTKPELRRAMKARLGELPAGRFAREGAAAAELFCGTALWSRHDRVLLYRTTGGEIDTRFLMESAFAAGKAVYFPKVLPGNAGEMVFFRADSPEGPWVEGAYGILEPPESPGGLFRAGECPALVITPGLAFDRRGNRLGRGRGYYDRFLSSLESSGARYEAAGFCLSCQIVEAVPVEPLDRPLHALCSALAFLHFR